MSTRGGDSAAHRASRDIGEEFEVWIDRQHEKAGLRGALAHIVHNAPPTKMVDGRLIYEKAAVADYTGILVGGVYLAAEAKSVVPGGRLQKSRVSPKQQDHLNAVLAAGGFAFLLVEYRTSASVHHRRYAIPWQLVPWKMIRTAESLDEGSIPIAYQIAPIGPDYLRNYHGGSDKRFVIGERRLARVYPTE